MRPNDAATPATSAPRARRDREAQAGGAQTGGAQAGGPQAGGALSFRAVNGWRGFGAIAIAIAHFSVAADFISYQRLLPVPLLVDLFFVLSGLVMAQVYAAKLADPAAFPEYVIRRFGRIWPLQAATLAVLVVYEFAKLAMQTLFGHHFSSPAFSAEGFNLLQAIPTNLLLIHSLGVHDRETWNFPSWSLSVEFATYIFFAVFCLFKPRLRFILAVITIAASLAILVVVAPYHMRSTFDYGLFRCFAGFFAGTISYDIARRWQGRTFPMPTLVECAGTLLLGTWLVVSVGSPLIYAAPFVICAFMLCFTSERGLLSRLLLTKPIQFLAELSFAIYMVHAIVLIVLLACLHEYEQMSGRHLFTKVPNPLAGRPGAFPTMEVLHTGVASDGALAVVYFIAVLALAWVAYRFVEVPGRAYFARVAKHVSKASARRVAPLPAEPMERAP